MIKVEMVNIRPSAITDNKSSFAWFTTEAWIYNEVDLTYNQIDVLYNGFASTLVNTDLSDLIEIKSQPLLVKSETRKNLITTRLAKIFTDSKQSNNNLEVNTDKPKTDTRIQKEDLKVGSLKPSISSEKTEVKINSAKPQVKMD